MAQNYGSTEDTEVTQKISEEILQPESPRRPKLVIFILLSAMLLMAMAVSILAPFYAEEANLRGVTASEYGFIFGVFDLVTCICSFPVGSMVSKFGPRTIVISGIFVEAISTLAFATLTFISNETCFLAVSYICRIIGAIGKVFINVGILTLFPLLDLDNAATLISWGESVYGAGFIIAPTIGGFLYQLGGLAVPFLVTGALLCILFLVALCFIPARQVESQQTLQNRNLLLSLLRNPKAWVCLLGGAVVPAYIAFVFATFEPSVRFLHLSPSTVGMLFAMSAVTYMASSIVSGWLCDRNIDPLTFMIFGSFISGVGVISIALSTIFAGYTIYLDILGLAVMGLGSGALFVPTLVYMKRMCIASGFSEDSGTFGVISGFFVAAKSLGGVVGPTVGGVLYDTIGFTYSNIIFVVLYILTGCFTILLQFTEPSSN